MEENESYELGKVTIAATMVKGGLTRLQACNICNGLTLAMWSWWSLVATTMLKSRVLECCLRVKERRKISRMPRRLLEGQMNWEWMNLKEESAIFGLVGQKGTLQFDPNKVCNASTNFRCRNLSGMTTRRVDVYALCVHPQQIFSHRCTWKMPSGWKEGGWCGNSPSDFIL